MNTKALLLALFIVGAFAAHKNEFVLKAERKHNLYAISDEALPDAFTWGDKDGINYLTKSLNQHIPQYCGSCWAHGAASAFSDRIKIAAGGNVEDQIVSIQYILNCGNAGSCYGGDHLSVYEFIHGKDWPFDTSNPYIACSSDSQEGFCGHVDTTCNALNTARTCATFGKECVGLTKYPNATIDKYGSVSGADAMKSEILKRGPIACGVNAVPLLDYHGGVFDDNTEGKGVDHIISIVGWGKDETTGKQYWIVRNSWGQYWGEMGYFRTVLGTNQLGLESDCAWATVGDYTTHNFPCNEGGDNCE